MDMMVFILGLMFETATQKSDSMSNFNPYVFIYYLFYKISFFIILSIPITT